MNPTDHLPDRLLSLEEAAAMLGVAKRTLYLKTRNGEFKFVRLPGSRQFRYRLSTLMKLIEDRERTRE